MIENGNRIHRWTHGPQEHVKTRNKIPVEERETFFYIRVRGYLFLEWIWRGKAFGMRKGGSPSELAKNETKNKRRRNIGEGICIE
ncbi:hypothetical protein COI59_30050 [Bacillus toyonensis]|nr:hypothetical protein COI59_30050 [Bacillus toyonensis]